MQQQRTKGGRAARRAQQVLFSPCATPPCAVCVCVWIFLPRPSGHYIKEPDRRKKRPSLSLCACRNVFSWPADSLDAECAAYLTLHYVILSDRHAEHKEKLRKRFRIADTSKWAQTVCERCIKHTQTANKYTAH
jgi:hypothetical protein